MTVNEVCIPGGGVLHIEHDNEEHIIGDDFHGEVDEVLFNKLVIDHTIDSVINQNNPTTGSSRACVAPGGPQTMVAVNPMKKIPKFSSEKSFTTCN